MAVMSAAHRAELPGSYQCCCISLWQKLFLEKFFQLPLSLVILLPSPGFAEEQGRGSYHLLSTAQGVHGEDKIHNWGQQQLCQML